MPRKKLETFNKKRSKSEGGKKNKDKECRRRLRIRKESMALHAVPHLEGAPGKGLKTRSG